MFKSPASKRTPSVHPTGNMTLLMVAVVVAALYFARVVFIPLALALLLAFVLAPLVNRARRWGLGRIWSVVLVVLFSFSLLLTIGGVMGLQIANLAQKLPSYQQNFHQKLQSIQSSGGGLVRGVANAVRDFKNALNLEPSQPPSNRSDEQKPVPVEIHGSAFSPLDFIRHLLSSVVEILFMAALVIVFVIFMLVQQEDLRDRVIRLAGADRVWTTTRVLNDATRRVSRYLLAQVVVNATYGLLVGFSLYLLKVPNPLLWGLTATLLRYVPYLGIWIAAAMAALVAFAVEPGWIMLPIIFGIYAGIDMILYNFVEPFLYGTSAGVSPFAVLVAAVFWTWLWGPVGLLLSTPLTVCVVVIGRHVPRLEFLSLLLSDESVLSPEIRLYQRLVASDLIEAGEIAGEFLKTGTREQFYDAVVLPALIMAGEDQVHGRMTEGRGRLFWENARRFVEKLSVKTGTPNTGQAAWPDGSSRDPAHGGDSPAKSETEPSVWCLPAEQEADGIAALMLTQLLNACGIRAICESLSADMLERRLDEGPTVLCVCSVPFEGQVNIRSLRSRLQGGAPGSKVVLLLLTEGAVPELDRVLPQIQPGQVARSFRRAVAVVRAVAGRQGCEQTEPVK